MMETLNSTERIQIKDGIMNNAIYIPSVNFNSRPVNTEIDLLVIHCASLPEGEYSNSNLEQLFAGQISQQQLLALNLPANLEVSTHVYINRWGLIYQFVPFNKRAWHAGVSCFNGREGCNDFSIGIELQGTDHTTFTKEQYDSLIVVTKSICAAYSSITKDTIVGHSMIAPTRKTDPGAMFDWEFYLNNI